MTAPSLQQHLRAMAQFARTRGARNAKSPHASIRLLMESIPTGAYACDADGLITHYNERALAIWGRAPYLNDERDRFCGSFRLFTPDGEPVAHAECWMALTLRYGREYVGEEIVVERPDGSRSTVVVHASPLHDESGNLTGALNILTDISELRRAEAAQRGAEAESRQVRQSESLGVLAGGIAHDFNNLLNRINGSATLTQRQIPADSPAMPLLDDIRSAVAQAATLVEQMLAYAGETQITREPVALDAVVLDALQVIHNRTAPSPPIHLELAPAVVDGDLRQMRQIAVNLVLNAVEALDEHPGRLVIRTREIEASAAHLHSRFDNGNPAPGRYAIIEVDDGGPGLAEDEIDRIFEPYYTTRFIGRGLGLSAVLGATRSHGGVIQVESTPGKGSTFRVLLPVQAAAPPASPPGPTEFDPSKVYPLFGPSRD